MPNSCKTIVLGTSPIQIKVLHFKIDTAKFDGRELRDRSGHKIGILDGKYIRDDHGSKVGEIENKYFRDSRGSKVAEFDGRDIRDSSGSKIATIDDVRKAIDGIGGASLVGMWIFFVR